MWFGWGGEHEYSSSAHVLGVMFVGRLRLFGERDLFLASCVKGLVRSEFCMPRRAFWRHRVPSPKSSSSHRDIPKHAGASTQPPSVFACICATCLLKPYPVRGGDPEDHEWRRRSSVGGVPSAPGTQGGVKNALLAQGLLSFFQSRTWGKMFQDPNTFIVACFG